MVTLSASHEVWAVARKPLSPSPHPSITWLQWDLNHPALPPELPAAADVVVHLAQSEHYRDFPAQAMDVFNVNVASTAMLLDWSRRAGVSQFILASSGGVGGAQRSHSYYLASKQSAESLSAGYAALFQVLVTRFFFVYGSGQKRGMLVPRLIDAVQSGDRIPLDGADGPRLNPVHVDDAVERSAACDRAERGWHDRDCWSRSPDGAGDGRNDRDADGPRRPFRLQCERHTRGSGRRHHRDEPPVDRATLLVRGRRRRADSLVFACLNPAKK